MMVEAGSTDDLLAVSEALRPLAGSVPVLVLGNGSNLLVADRGFGGLVVSPGRSMAEVEIAGTTLRVGAASSMPVVARQASAAGLMGFEWAVGIPGSVGGAVCMNAGGHGSDMAAVLLGARAVDLVAGRVVDLPAERLGLGYRTSAIGSGQVVVSAELSLEAGDAAEAMAQIGEIVRWRREHQPGGSNAGSVFMNPEGDSAGRLVEQAGLKGFRMGSARVSEKHGNFIQADEGGSADDVARLVFHVQGVVAERLGVWLTPEIRMVGFDQAGSAGSPP